MCQCSGGNRSCDSIQGSEEDPGFAPWVTSEQSAAAATASLVRQAEREIGKRIAGVDDAGMVGDIMRMRGRCLSALIVAISSTLWSGCDLGLEVTTSHTADSISTSAAPAAAGAPLTAQTLAAPAASAATHVDPKGAEKLLKENPKVIILDVRTPEEFAGGHLAGATNINFSAKDFRSSLETLDRQATYLVHCAVGGRSRRSLPILEQLGFKSVVHLDGGIEAWKEAGLPVKP